MADHPYETEWIKDGKPKTMVVFARSVLAATNIMRDDHGIWYASAIPLGNPAECMVRYTLRGGLVYGETFYYRDGKGPQSVPLSEVTGLRYHK